MSAADPPGRGVLVIGMHRSGTSAMTRVLNLLGLPLCRSEDLLPHRNGNPTGHWESATLMAFNEKLLAALGARWNRLPPVSDPLARGHALAAFAPAARATFQQAHASATWVWKDPRLCLLVSFWRTVLACNPPLVLMLRHPDEIATSLHRRDGVDRVTSLRLWQDSNEHALLGSAGAPLIVVRHPDLITDPVGTSHRLVSFLTEQGIPAQRNDDAVRAFIDPGLHHAHIAPRTAEQTGDLTAAQQALLEVLRSLNPQYKSFQPPPTESVAGVDGHLPPEWRQWFRVATSRGCRPDDIVVSALRGGLPLHLLARAIDELVECRTASPPT